MIWLVNPFICLMQVKRKKSNEIFKLIEHLHHQYYLIIQSNKQVYSVKYYKVCWFYCLTNFLKHVIMILIDFSISIDVPK